MQDIFAGNDLALIEEAVWELLLKGTTSHKAIFHYGTVANVQDGSAAVRTVIVRHTDPLLKKITFHTDIRSSKIAALQKDPAVSWLFYDEARKLQLRLKATSQLHYQNETTEAAWQKLKVNSQLTYAIADAPGELLAEPKTLASLGNEAELIQFAKNNFAVVETKVLSIDFLMLHHSGNRRAFFDCVTQERYWVQA